MTTTAHPTRLPDRRSICRECGRGADAPHMIDCETGRTRHTYASFNLDRFIHDMLTEKDES